MKHLSLLTLVFSILFAVFFLLLVFFRIPFPPYPLMSYQDVFDILTPLVLIPLYWLLFKYSASGESRLAEEITFMVLAAVWVLGQGMHLAANSINNLAEGLTREGGIEYHQNRHLHTYLLPRRTPEPLLVACRYPGPDGIIDLSGMAATRWSQNNLVGNHPRRAYLRLYILLHLPRRTDGAARSPLYNHNHLTDTNMGS